MQFTRKEKDFLYNHCLVLSNFLTQWLFTPISAILSELPNEELDNLRSSVAQVLEHLISNQTTELDPRYAPYIRLALEMGRKEIAEKQETLRQRTSNPTNQENISLLSNRIEDLLRHPDIASCKPFDIPHPLKFVTLDAISVDPPSKRDKVERLLDDKFRILQAQRTFKPILKELREESFIRNTPVTVVFADIDKFKDLNTATNEQRVDREVIPKVMQTILAHTYSHAEAFRFGGDEYVLIIPNLSESIVQEFLRELQKKLAKLRFTDYDGGISISIGYMVVSPMTQVTDNEALEFANKAVKKVKETERGKIARFTWVSTSVHAISLID